MAKTSVVKHKNDWAKVSSSHSLLNPQLAADLHSGKAEALFECPFLSKEDESIFLETWNVLLLKVKGLFHED